MNAKTEAHESLLGHISLIGGATNLSYGLASVLNSQGGHSVVMLVDSADEEADINLHRLHRKFRNLPESAKGPYRVHPLSVATTDAKRALEHARLVIVTAPARDSRRIVESYLLPHLAPQVPLAILTKGLDPETGEPITAVYRRLLPNNPVTFVTGPMYPDQLGDWTDVSVTGVDPTAASLVAHVLQGGSLMVETVLGEDALAISELAGALKCVASIANGIVEGLGHPENTQAVIFRWGFDCLSDYLAMMGYDVHEKLELLTSAPVLGDIWASTRAPSRNYELGRRIGEAWRTTRERAPELIARLAQDPTFFAQGLATVEVAYRAVRHFRGALRPETRQYITTLYGILNGDLPAEDMVRRLILRPSLHRNTSLLPSDDLDEPVAWLGAGNLGIALAVQLALHNHQQSVLWVRRTEVRDALNQEKIHPKHASLPKEAQDAYRVRSAIWTTDNSDDALRQAGKMIVVCTPAQQTRDLILERLVGKLRPGTIIVGIMKGLEISTGMRMSQIFGELVPEAKFVYLSGPNHATQLGHYTDVFLSSENQDAVAHAARIFSGGSMMVENSVGKDELAIAEYAAALKNVAAIACGITKGLGHSVNAQAIVFRWGFHFICEYIKLKGIDLRKTMHLLFKAHVLGDYWVTTRPPSRNYNLGEAIGSAWKADGTMAPETIEQLQRDTGKLAEGHPTTLAVRQDFDRLISDRREVDADALLFIRVLDGILRGSVDPSRMVNALSLRPRLHGHEKDRSQDLSDLLAQLTDV
jgi:glycerol-3-phosphate dehydrogenase (NAD(P)+)